MTDPDVLYAWIGVDGTGPHVIAAGLLSERYATPLVTLRQDLAEKMQPFAKAHAIATGHAVTLVRFDGRGGLLRTVEPTR